MIQKTELLLAKEERFAAVLSDRAKPIDANEALEFAGRCYQSKQYADAARLFTAAIKADPAIATDMDRRTVTMQLAPRRWRLGQRRPSQRRRTLPARASGASRP